MFQVTVEEIPHLRWGWVYFAEFLKNGYSQGFLIHHQSRF